MSVFLRTPALPRRKFLRAAGGLGFGLPFLDAMVGVSSRQARAQAFPQRFVSFFNAMGYGLEKDMYPTGTETNFTLAYNMQDLAPHKADLVVIKPLRDLVATRSGGLNHEYMAELMSGVPPLRGSLPGNGCANIPGGSAGGPTIDAVIAQRSAGQTAFPSLEFGFEDMYDNTFCGSAQRYVSYRTAGQANVPEGKPGRMFNKLMGATGQVLDPQAAERLRARKQSVIDAVKGDLSDLLPRLGGSDRRRVDEHLTGIREIERRLTMTVSAGAACGSPTAPPTTLADGRNKNFNLTPDITKLHIDMLVLALSCDMTRVGTIQLGTSSGGEQYPFKGFRLDWHWHWPYEDARDGRLSGADATNFAAYRAVHRWFGEMFGYLIDKMKAVPEGDKTLFHNSLCMWWSDMGIQTLHTTVNHAFVLAGQAGGKLRTGRFLDMGSTGTGVQGYPIGRYNVQHLLTSIMNVFGDPTTAFGDASISTGALPGLV